MKYKYCPYREEDKLNGIFVFLNANYVNAFTIEVSTHENSASTPYDITRRDNDNDDSFWYSDNDNEMIFSFRYPILLDGYTIENAGYYHSWMANWTIFGSNDKRNWELIDQRQGEIFCDSPYSNTLGLHCFDTKTISYFVDNPKFYSRFKIRNDLNSCDEKYIIMHSLEFHGLTTFQ